MRNTVNLDDARKNRINSRSPCVGPVVRVSPTLCSISDPAALKTVYGGKFAKSQRRYEGKTYAGHEHLLMFDDPKRIKERRGLLLPLFQRSNLDAFTEEIQRYTTQMIEQMMEEQKTAGNVDVFRWLRLAAFDIIGTLQFPSNCCISLRA